MSEPGMHIGDASLQRGFLLGEWTVRPLAGLLQRNGHELHLEPKVMDVLVCLARHQGEVVTREVLLAEVWGKVIVTDDAITRCVSDLRTLLGDTNRERSYIRTIPRRGYSLMVPVQPLNPIEPAPAAAGSGEGETPVIATLTVPARPRGRRLRIAAYISAAALVALLPFLFKVARTGPPEPSVAAAAVAPVARPAKTLNAPAGKINSVAVLPFVNLGNDPAQQNFSDGLSEDIRNALLTATGLRVAARTSSEVFRNRAMDVREIAAQLNVEALLEGTVRITGNRLRITTQLTHARDGYAVWAASFERDMTDRLQLQTEVAEEIVKQLGPTLGGTPGMPKSATANVEARDFYLLGRHHWHMRTAEAIDQAVAYFRQAIALDPNYALAYSGLADALVFQSLYGMRAFAEIEAPARAAIDKALALDPNLAEAYASRGLLLMSTGDLEGSLAANQRAVQLKPQYSMGQMWLGLALLDKGDVNGAYEHQAAALKVDPLHPLVQANYADTLMKLGRYDEAFEALDRFSRFNQSEALLKEQASGRLSQGRYDDVLNFAVSRSFSDEFKPYASAPVIEALIQLQRYPEAERMIADNGPAMEGPMRLYLQSDLAIARRDVPGILGIAEAILKPEVASEHGDVNRRCAGAWSAYLQGTAAWLSRDFANADARFAESGDRRVKDGCTEFEPDMEVLTLLYRAGSRARMQQGGGNMLVAAAVKRLQELKKLGWNTPELTSLEAVASFQRGDAAGSDAALQNLISHRWQPLGYMRSTPLFDDFLASDQFSKGWTRLAQGFDDVRARSGEISLAKLGL